MPTTHFPQSSQTSFEPLEPRTLMAATGPWVPYAQLVRQDQAFAAYPYLDGSNQTVAVVDRGVDYRHPQLGNGVVGPGKKIVGGYNFRDHNFNILDDYGHGTGVAGIIAADPYNYGGYNQGVAAGTHLIELKQESSADIKAALDWVIQYHSYYNIQVVNLTDFITDVLPNAWNPQLYVPELKTLHDLGIFLVTPVGNGEVFGNPSGNQAPITLPALSPYVFGVGGSTLSETMYPDSRRGAGLDLLAPAQDVTMPYYLIAKDAQGHIINPGYDQYDDNYTGADVLANYALGTSWASAYVAGTATLLKQINPAFTPDQIAQILIQTGDPIPDNENPAVTYPRLNILKATTLAFQLADDQYAGAGTGIASAAALPVSNGKVSLSNLRLVIGHPDFWSFNVAKTSKVNIKISDPSAKPFSVLFDANGNIVKTLPTNRSTSLNLRPGRYVVYLTSPQTLPGTYSLSVTGASTSVTAAFARPALATPSATPASPSATDVLLGKHPTPVFT